MIISMEVYRGEEPSAEEIAELEALDGRPIDYSDIPAMTHEESKKAVKYFISKPPY